MLQKFEQSNAAVWVGVENRGEDDGDQYWIGKATKVVQVYDKAGKVGRVSYGIGDVEVAVQWYHRDPAAGGEERRVFKLWTRNDAARDPGPVPGKVYTFNSTELRAIGDDIEMRPLGVGGAPLDVVQREARAVPVRAAAQRADEARRVNGLVYRAQAQRAPPPEQLLELSSGSEGLILNRCE